MKKIFKKIIGIGIASSLSIGSIAGISYGIYAANINPNHELTSSLANTRVFDENKDILFKNQYFLNVKDATDYLLESNQVDVREDLFIGDLNDAIINTNNYNMINTNKLKLYDHNTEIKKAYQTSLGTYTDDMLKAKKSMIGSKEVLYLDHEFNAFRSENRAKDSIDSKTNSVPISYYKVFDPAKNDYVNINPLNQKDALALKEIALNSVIGEYANDFPNKNNFSLKKYQVDHNVSSKNTDPNDKYIESSFTEKDIQESYKQLIDFLYKEAIKLAVFDVEIEPVFSNKNITWNLVNGKADLSYKVDINNKLDFNSGNYSYFLNKKTLSNIAGDLVYFIDRNNFLNGFDLKNDIELSFWKVFTKNAFSKKDIFGYSGIKIIYNGDRPWSAQGLASDLGKDVVDFFTGGNKSNVKFKIKIKPYRAKNQSDINKIVQHNFSKVKNKSFFKDFLNYIITSGNANLNSYGQIDWNVVKEIDKKMGYLVARIAAENSWVEKWEGLELDNTDKIKTHSGYGNILLNNNIYNEVSKRINSDNESTDNIFPQELSNLFKLSKEYRFFKEMDSTLKNIFWEEKKYQDKNTIYTINYNDIPLYNISFDNFVFDSSKTENQNLIEKIDLEVQESKDKNEFNKFLSDSLTNISNNIFIDKTNNKHYLSKKDSILNKKQKLINFNYSDNFSINSLELSSFFNVSDDQLLAKLNILKNDSIEFLKNSYGILQSIFYYNKNLNSINNSIPSITKDNLIKDTNEIPILWQTSTTLQPTYYGEYLGKNTELNFDIQNQTKRKVYSSIQGINEAKQNLLKLQPIQLFIIKDHFDNVINFEYLDKNINVANGKPITDGYGTNEQQAYENALNKINIYSDVNYVYYDNILVKNEVNKLYTLDLSKQTNLINTYSFSQYDHMYQYLYDFIKLNSVNVY